MDWRRQLMLVTWASFALLALSCTGQTANGFVRVRIAALIESSDVDVSENDMASAIANVVSELSKLSLTSNDVKVRQGGTATSFYFSIPATDTDVLKQEVEASRMHLVIPKGETVTVIRIHPESFEASTSTQSDPPEFKPSKDDRLQDFSSSGYTVGALVGAIIGTVVVFWLAVGAFYLYKNRSNIKLGSISSSRRSKASNNGSRRQSKSGGQNQDEIEFSPFFVSNPMGVSRRATQVSEVRV